jgi:hypothetical protein
MALKRTSPLRAKTPMPQFSEKRLAEFRANGWPANSTFTPRQREPRDKQPRRRDTGPPRATVELLFVRSGRICEWPDCGQSATEKHHRLNRKHGGRHGEAHKRVNGVAWLLHACHLHHAYVTSPSGERRETAIAMGWLLLENQDATQVPVLTCHDDEPVWLDADGYWHVFEAGVA